MSSNYDTVIIGAGLTGLLLTHRLHQAGQKVLLLEARDTLGGHYHRPSTVDFYPANDQVDELLRWAQSISPTPLELKIEEHRPQMFDDGKWKPFVGFGESNFLSVGEMSAFSFTHEIRPQPGFDQMVRALIEQLPVAAETLSEVTALRIADRGVHEIVVNDDKVIHAERVVFTPFPGSLNALCEGDGLPAKHRTRLAKMETWTAVTLEMMHSPALIDDTAIRVFNHGSKEFEPVIGRVFGDRSLWMTLVPGEREAEHEFIGQCIRHIKRQLKRAWPQALEGQHEEKIYLHPHAFGQHTLKTKEAFRYPEVRNLYLANHALGSQPGALGALEMARAVEVSIVGSADVAVVGIGSGKPDADA